MTKYEGLFILNLAASEEGVKDAIDRITAAIGEAGGKVENVQKMDKRIAPRKSAIKPTRLRNPWMFSSARPRSRFRSSTVS